MLETLGMMGAGLLNALAPINLFAIIVKQPFIIYRPIINTISVLFHTNYWSASIFTVNAVFPIFTILTIFSVFTTDIKKKNL